MADFPVRFHPGAEEEANNAWARYAKRSARAAAAFLVELDAAVFAISEAPSRWPPIHGRYRRFPMHKFPFSNVYAVRRNFRHATGLEPIDGFGATEMLQTFIAHAPERVRPGATGYVIPGYRARVVDDRGESLDVRRRHEASFEGRHGVGRWCGLPPAAGKRKQETHDGCPARSAAAGCPWVVRQRGGGAQERASCSMPMLMSSTGIVSWTFACITQRCSVTAVIPTKTSAATASIMCPYFRIPRCLLSMPYALTPDDDISRSVEAHGSSKSWRF